MKICYLILAHNNFNHLNRLIDSLNNDSCSFYIHIDKKSEYLNYYNTLDNVTVIGEHFNINWGGFSMIEATLALMKNAVLNSPESDYFILISGVDYPIRSHRFLLRQLDSGKEFIDTASLPFPDKPIVRFEYYYYDVNRRKHGYFHPLILTEIILRLFKLKRKIPFPIYVGGQWFALTRECTRYVLNTTEKDKRYISFFKHALIPDEAFFQTIIANSPFADKIVPNLTYTDWTVKNPPAKISSRHIDFFKKNIKLEDEYGARYPYFARKFDDNSTEIINIIEKELRT